MQEQGAHVPLSERYKSHLRRLLDVGAGQGGDRGDDGGEEQRRGEPHYAPRGHPAPGIFIGKVETRKGKDLGNESSFLSRPPAGIPPRP